MAEHAHGASSDHVASDGSISIPWTVLASVLVGLGLFGMAYWLVTFSWLLFLSVIPLSIGAVLLFTRATGAEHA